ncbi:MAG: glycosyl transferase group 1 [Bacteroidetes bacterium]|nr:MAG: glycosyl transferase group 1 [Bacteroidota bacterium]
MNKNLKNKKVVILSVTNDLTADQRVHKVALTLIKCGFLPLLIGRELKNSQAIIDRPYLTKRMRLIFTKGPLFYAEYNFRLFLFLLFQKANLLVANDLDTLMGNYLAYRIKSIFLRGNVQIVYDSHEYFTEVPELNGRPFVKNVWLTIEKMILPQIKYSYTVCDSISEIYNKKYGVEMQVVRNIPLCKKQSDKKKESNSFVREYAGKKIILYQGALNVGRGIEHVILAMEFINNAIFVIIGDGDITNQLKNMVTNKKLSDKVRFIGKIPFNSSSKYTENADIGMVLQEDLSLSYHLVLPNRLFDYIHAELPVIASDLPEIKKIFSENEIGLLISDLNPENLAKKITFLLNDIEKHEQIKANLKSIKEKYCWEKEEEKLIKLFTNF